MTFDAATLSKSILESVTNARGTTMLTLDVRTWGNGEVRQLVDRLLDGLKSTKFQMRGVRADNFGFAHFNIKMDTMNSGKYQNVPVVIDPTKPFDTIELVFMAKP